MDSPLISCYRMIERTRSRTDRDERGTSDLYIISITLPAVELRTTGG